MRKWIGLHSYSTWMIVASIVAGSMSVHPSLLSYLLVAINAGWMILTREVARSEGATHTMCTPCVLGGSFIIAICLLVAIKINWLAL